MENSTATMFAVVQNFFEQDGWPVYQIEEQRLLQTNFSGDNGSWQCIAEVREAEQQFLFYSICPVHVPTPHRLTMAEFLTRANCGLTVGNFEMDFTDGEIRFKTSIDVEGDRLSEALVKQLVYTNVLLVDKYLPGIMSVIYSDALPVEAIYEIEGERI